MGQTYPCMESVIFFLDTVSFKLWSEIHLRPPWWFQIFVLKKLDYLSVENVVLFMDEKDPDESHSFNIYVKIYYIVYMSESVWNILYKLYNIE